jgi:hypothetical protein
MKNTWEKLLRGSMRNFMDYSKIHSPCKVKSSFFGGAFYSKQC